MTVVPLKKQLFFELSLSPFNSLTTPGCTGKIIESSIKLLIGVEESPGLRT